MREEDFISIEDWANLRNLKYSAEHDKEQRKLKEL